MYVILFFHYPCFIFVSNSYFFIYLVYLQPPLPLRPPHPHFLGCVLLPPTLAIPLTTLKRCLHFDPGSKPCLTLYPLVKEFDKSLHLMSAKEDRRGVIKPPMCSPLNPQAHLQSPSSWFIIYRDHLYNDSHALETSQESIHLPNAARSIAQTADAP
ncbi:hypothetical protein BJ165DRAFT_329982 [Panaeolus papilionaceus]|nr:hypothetical protein BJ165DRAFT_329982 [Panaeolus papilionaceus]